MQKLSKTAAIMGLLAPLGASALGIGDIRLHSALNQSFNAEIPLVLSGADSLSDVKISLASPEAFAKAGIERHYFLTRLRFNAIQKSDGSYVIRVGSSDVIREPFLNFLVEVNWPQGRVLREFTVLLDPPSTLPETAIAETEAPAIRQPQAGHERVAEISRSEALGHITQHGSQHPTPPSAPIQFTGSDYGPVQRNQTLWSIAQEVSQPGVPQAGMVRALFLANPRAFRGSVNTLQAGATLRIPTAESIAQLTGLRLRKGQAGAAPAKAGDQAPQSQIKLLSATDAKAKGEGAVAGTENGPAKAKTDLALEVAETVRQENEEFRSRLTQLEQKLVEMERMLAIKDEQLATLRAQTQASAQPATSEKPAPAIQPSVAPTPQVAQQPTTSPAEPATAREPAPAVTTEPAVTLPTTHETPPTPEPPKAIAPQPKPKPVVAPAPSQAAEPGFFGALLEQPFYFVAAAGGLAALLGAAWMVFRRRAAMIAETESILMASERERESLQKAQITATSFAETPRPEMVAATKSSFLSEFTPSDFDALGNESEEVDPVSEADVYLAYGRYKQAEELIRNAIEQHPDRNECKLKLLEIHYTTENHEAFVQYAQELKSEGKDAQQDFWAKVVEMGRELLPGSPLFTAGSPSPTRATPRADVAPAAEVLGSLDLSDDLIEELKRFEIEVGRPSGAIEVDTPKKEAEQSAETQPAPGTASESYALFDFDLGVLDVETRPEPEEKPKIEEPASELDNLIAFDFGKTKPATQGRDESSAKSEKTIDDILRELSSDAPHAESEPQPPVSKPGGGKLDLALELVADVQDSSEEQAGDVFTGLTDMDQLETKLDLAKAYADMDDEDSAREILLEVLQQGNEEQKAEAQALLQTLKDTTAPPLSLAESRSHRM